MTTYKTEQENFWAGDFGDEYSKRNKDQRSVISNIALFGRIFSRVNKISTIIEFGANIGLNLRAINTLLPEADLYAVEINKAAANELNRWGIATVYNQSLLDYRIERKFDFVLTKGLLIHVSPDELPAVYEILYKACGRYICLAEYYNPVPVSVSYRGHKNKLFKRDFAGEILDKFDDLSLVDYGFVYHRDIHFPQDDITWFLLERR